MAVADDSLLARPAAFGFVEAVDAAIAAAPGSAEPGGDAPPSREAVRLRPALSLAFPTADVVAAERLPEAGDGKERIRIEATFLGVYGQASPLPAYVTEQVLADERGAVRDFLDIFHHRLLSLAWRAFTKYRLDRSRVHDERLRALAGYPPGLALPAIPGGGVLAVAGLLARQPRSAAALAGAIAHWLGGLAVEVEQCVPVWVDLPPERRCRLGAANCGAGTDLLAGERIFSRTTAFAVVVGPVGAADLARFLPGGDAMAVIGALVAECNPGFLDWSVEVVLAGGAVPPAALAGGVRLGWDARLDGPPAGDQRIRIAC